MHALDYITGWCDAQLAEILSRRVSEPIPPVTGEIGYQQARDHRDVVAQMQKIRDLEACVQHDLSSLLLWNSVVTFQASSYPEAHHPQDEIVERIKFREHCEVEEAKARAVVREREAGTFREV